MSYKIIAVVGPTAVGKSDVGVRLAQLFDGEIINGDSIQVYRELNIGSAKITEKEMGGVIHHLLDYKNVGDEYSVQHFQHDAREKIDEIEERGHLPVVVGGTGLYIKALLYDYSFTQIEGKLNEYENEKTEDLYERLCQLDPKAVEVIHPNNRRRIVRALQMAESGNLKSEQEAGQKHEMIYDAFIVGLTMDRKVLKERIGFGTIFDALLVGNMIQLLNDLNPLPLNKGILTGIPIMLLGFVFMAVGQWIYMSGAQCCGPRDMLLVGIGKRLPKVPIGVVEVLLWAAVVTVGWMLGGPVGVGTLLSVFGAGLVMQAVLTVVHFEPREVQNRDCAEVLKILAEKNGT